MTQPALADPVERFIAEVKWRFARTMAQWPHWIRRVTLAIGIMRHDARIQLTGYNGAVWSSRE